MILEQAYQDLQETGARTTKHKWFKVLEEHEHINEDLEVFYSDEDTYQVIDNFGVDKYVLRIFENQYGKIFERFRITFDEGGIFDIYKMKSLGQSMARAFLPAKRQMGYHEEDQPYGYNTITYDRANYFKYIDLTKLNIPAVRLLENKKLAYSVELLQKQGHKMFAELWTVHFPYQDIKKLLKKSWVFDKPTANKIAFALNSKHKYQHGMLKYNTDYLNDLLDIVNWKKWKRLEKKGYNYIDFVDYRKNNREYGFPDYPKDLQKAKTKLQEHIEFKENKELDRKISERKLKPISKNGITATPFKTALELKENGEELQMCIFDYREDYANGEKDLYHIDNECSIEVKNGIVRQCRGEYNKDLTSKYKGIIKEIERQYKEMT